MENFQNTSVLVVIMLVIAVTGFGCRGAGKSSLRENLLAHRNAPLNGQSAKTSESAASGRAKIDIDAVEKETSRVALASYENQKDNDKQAKWLESYDEAVELSKQSGKPILADFTGSNWCGYCVKLKNEVFDTPQFKAWAAENVVLLELDYPKPNLQADWIKQQNHMLLKRYKIDSYPSVLILNPDGSVIGSQGYQRGGADRWIAVVNNTIKSNRALQNAKLVDASSLDTLQ